ncbi:MAG TPA: MMPL family transporter [Ktedonobacterales bacterium]|nr:MMPL family transporter [Ktedonobacterales bacterium]
MQLQERPRGVGVGMADVEAAAHTKGALQGHHKAYRVGLAYGDFVYRFRWFIIALWLIALAISIPFAKDVANVLTGSGGGNSNSESAQVSNLLISKLHQPATQLIVVFQSSTTPVTAATYQQEVNSFINRAHAFPHVSGIISGGVGKDGRTTYLVVNFDTGSSYVRQHLDDLRALLPAGPATPHLTGDAVVDSELSQITQQDTEQAELVALPIALVVLIIVFGSLIAALTPLLLAVVAVPVALALVYLIAVHTPTSVFVLNVASIIGLGISIDYSLFMVRRFRDELAQGRSPREAVAWTVATSGEAILFSGLTVMIGFLALILIRISFMVSFGIGGAVVVAATVLAALTFLPALLGVGARFVNAVRVPVLGHFVGVKSANAADSANATEGRSFWRSWSLAVMRRPILIVVVVSVLLLAMGWPVFSMNIGTLDASSLPAGSEARQSLELLNAQFPSNSEHPILITVQTPDGSSILTAANLAKIDHLTQWLAAQPHVTGVTSLTRLPAQPGAPAQNEAQLAALYTSGTYQENAGLAQFVASTTAHDITLITVKSDTVFDSTAGKDLISQLRAGDQAASQGLTVLVGGDQASDADYVNAVYGNFPWAILFILLSTYVLLLIMFRSLLLPLKAILMNVLSISATYGVLVFVFQWGNFSNVLGFTATGSLDSSIPIVLFCVIFGLSMDYEVFLLSRIREEWLRTADNRQAVARGLEKTGGVITNAALLFVIVTGAFTFTSLLATKEIGLGMTVAVVVDATIIRSLLVPATMRLLGRWNWWLPGRPLPGQKKQAVEAVPQL